jgi:ADP-ribosylglycohydrolase
MDELSSKPLLVQKVLGCLIGGAVGDAMGAPPEGKNPDEIRARYGWITDFVEPWDGPSPLGKGDGRYTDDSHMVQILSRIYLDADDHLDVYRFAKEIVPPIADRPRYVPERGRDMLLLDRLFYPEKWLYIRLRLANVDPRIGGLGNMVNCGAAMYAAPVGIVNACDPQTAYREAIEIFSAHQHSFGLEAAGVMAACVAEAFRPGASVDSVVGVALSLAKEGTRAAIAAVVDCARTQSDWRAAIEPLRSAIQPYDGAAEDFHDRGNGSNDWNPSRMHSIEEVPIALGFLVTTGGDFEESVFGGANYGRDCDSIASMAGAIAGALHGVTTIRSQWIDQVQQANRVDFTALAEPLADLTASLHKRRMEQLRMIDEGFAVLQQQPAS